MRASPCHKLLAMEFRIKASTPVDVVVRHFLRGGQSDIYASGEIQPGDAVRFADWISANAVSWARVVFNSQGGALIEGLRLGEAIRSLGFDSGIGDFDEGRPAICASAAAYAFAGGVNRFYRDRDGKLGIHRFFSDHDLLADDAQIVSGWLVTYLRRMGVDATAFSRAAEAGAGEMVWLSPGEAEKLGFANNGTRPTSAEIRLQDGQPYLRMEQVHHDVTSRVLLSHVGGQFVLMGGIVTSPETAAEKSSPIRHYFEFDGDEALVMLGSQGVSAEGAVVWLQRTPDFREVWKLAISDFMEMWTEHGDPFRWGSSIDLRPIRASVVGFIENFRSV